MDNTDSMVRYQHMMSAEESISAFIKYLEMEPEAGLGAEYSLSKEDKEWLFKRGEEVFNRYYIDGQLTITLTVEEDKIEMHNHFARIQEVMGDMFAHIMLLEFKMYLFTRYL